MLLFDEVKKITGLSVLSWSSLYVIQANPDVLKWKHYLMITHFCIDPVPYGRIIEFCLPSLKQAANSNEILPVRNFE